MTQNKLSITRFVEYMSLSAIFILASLIIPISSPIVHAANAGNFDPGRIIDDSVFFNSGAMTASDIQSFLNNKVPVCDTQGSQSYSGSTTRAQYAASKGYSAPFTCLRDYAAGTIAKSADAYCSGYPSTVQTAAQMIYGVGQSCGINPQVLIVLLQKEQGLVTDTWPWSSQYRIAVGYGCPDTAACDSNYYGFFNQIYSAARQYRYYQANAAQFSYRAYRNNNVLWNPNSACGSSTVNIQNQATAGLYNYTPYRPNGAALAAGYGSGDNCSSYGNRNFWLYFTDWFGSTRETLPRCTITASNTACVWRLTLPNGYQFLTSSIDERNSAIANGATYVGIAFHVHTQSVPGSLPVYRVLLPNGEHIWTIDANEMNALVSGGSTNEGIAWYVDPASANTSYPVYRLSSSSGHILTSDATERDRLIARGYTSEGIPFAAPSSIIEVWAPSANTADIFRLYNPVNGEHFWTSNVLERDILAAFGGFRYEGIGTVGTQNSNQQSVYRLLDPRSGLHFWTTSTTEKDSLVRGGFSYEGVGWQVTGQGASVYRLFNGRDGKHFWTTSTTEKDSLVRGGFSYEGVGWQE